MGVFGPILSFVFLIIATILVYLFKDKMSSKPIIKKTLIGLIFTLISVISEIAIYKSYITLSKTVVLIGGVLFGGSVGLMSGALCSLIRFFILGHCSLSFDNVSSLLTLIIAGLLSVLINKFLSNKNGTKHIFSILGSAVIEVSNMMLMFLLCSNNSVDVYDIVKGLGMINLVINCIAVFIVLYINCLISKTPVFKIEKPIGIQTRIQLFLGVAIIIGFTGVASISSGVLQNSSKESIKSTINVTLKDIYKNVDDDIGASLLENFKTYIVDLKKTGISFVSGTEAELEQRVDVLEKMNYYKGFRYLSDVTFIREDGTIYKSTNNFITNLNNISELEIQQYDVENNTDYLTLTYQNVNQLNGNYKFIYGRYNDKYKNYYVLGMIDENLYSTHYLANSINKGVASRHIGDNGYVLVYDNNGSLASSPTDSIDASFSIDFSHKNSLVKQRVNDVDYYCYIEEVAGYKIVALMDKKTCDLNTNISLYITSFTEALVFFILYTLIFLSIRASVITPLEKVNGSLKTICEGKLDEKLVEKSSAELQNLSEGINDTVESLKVYMSKEVSMIQNELNFAKQIQLSSLPTNFSMLCDSNNFDLYASMKTAKEVGGDFYDFYKIDDNHLCILIADVSGKGVPAAMFMMQSKTILKELIESKMSLDKAFTLANSKLLESNSAQMFVTVFCGVLELNTGLFSFVNAGHNPPLIKTSGEFSYLKAKPGIVLAGFDSYEYKIQTITLKPGDEIYLYTDGVTEAQNNDEKLFGEQRLVETANNIKYKSSKEFCECIMNALDEYSESAEQFDDITMLHLRLNKAK